MTRQIGREVKIISNLVRRRIDAQASALGIEDMTGTQLWVLHYLHHNTQTGPVFQRDIERQFGIRAPTATGLLQQLERKGLIERLPVEGDGRLKSLVPTARAERLRIAMEADREATEALMRRGVTAGELEVFFTVMDRIRENLEEGDRQ